MKGKLLLAYLGGIIDGEGSIYIRKSARQHSVCIACNMLDFRAVLLLSKTFGGGFYIDKTKYGNTRYCWLASTKQAISILNRLLPYLVIKRDQALLAIEFYNKCIGRWKTGSRYGHKGTLKIPEELMKVRDEYKNKLSVMKYKYPIMELQKQVK